MTAQQVELLGILRNFGPLTRKAVMEILSGRDCLGAYYPRPSSYKPNAVGERLCTLERRGWAESKNTWDIYFLGCCLRCRKLWMITYSGLQALKAKEVRHERV